MVRTVRQCLKVPQIVKKLSSLVLKKKQNGRRAIGFEMWLHVTTLASRHC